MKYVTLAIMAVVYLLASVRYFPGDIPKTAMETVLHMLSAALLTIGCTMLAVIFFQKMSKVKLPWDKVLRIYLLLAIFFELILGIQNYGAVGGV